MKPVNASSSRDVIFWVLFTLVVICVGIPFALADVDYFGVYK